MFGTITHRNRNFIMTFIWDIISTFQFLFVVFGVQATAKARATSPSFVGPQEFCHLETFNASCPHDSVIVMQSARYGRMKVGRCVKRNLGYLGCAVDVMRYMDAHCSGRKLCRVSIVDLAKTEMKPCPEDVTSYLEASYQCLPVAGSTRHCSNHQTKLPPTGGYLASALVTERGFGSSRCPWIIEVQPGQRINITLHNFARTTTTALSNSQGGGGRRSDACYEFALVREAGAKKSIVGCVGDQRETAVYTSTSNSVQIYVLDRVISSQSVYFLLEYSVIGCPLVPQIKGAIIETKGTTATIKCNNTGEVFYLTCKDREWIGDFNNCSLSAQWTLTDIFGEETDFPYGILIVVAIGVALGVFFGGLLLFTISMFLKRNHKKQERKTNRDNQYNEAMHDEHAMISEPDYSTGLIQKPMDCHRGSIPVHCTETPTPVSTAMSLKRGTTTTQYGPDGLPPPPSFLLTTKSHGHHYESPTFT